MERVSNRAMRRTSLERQGLSTPTRAGFDKHRLLEVINQLAYLQIDSINVVERAHHLILFSRNSRYRREMLSELLEKDRLLFEHWTHDASILPASYFPHWRHRFDAARRRLNEPAWRKRLGLRPQQVLDRVKRRIHQEGPLRTRDFENTSGVKRNSWWGWSREKTALEFLWRCGELGISRRDGFEKVYDRMEEIIPVRHRDEKVDQDASVDWKCRVALERLGVATAAELAGFWSSFPTGVARAWLDGEWAGGRVIGVVVETADGSSARPRFALPDFVDRLTETPTAPRGMRLLSPFDPLIRDRKRTSWLFGFDYRIEVFIPAGKRQYGYYVLPILEGERLTGRIDLKAHRKEGFLEVKGLWWEPHIQMTQRRDDALRRCLDCLAKFIGVGEVRGFAGSYQNALR